jgi:hypothetical protein
MLNSRHVTALRSLVETLASLHARRFDRQPERLTRKSVVRLAVGYSLGKITRSAGHVMLQNATTAQYSGNQKRILRKRQGLFPDIHRSAGTIENLLMIGKDGVSSQAPR